MKVLVDTNLLLSILDARGPRVDFANAIRERYLDAELCVLMQSLDEIRALKPSAAPIVEKYVRDNKFTVVSGRGKADDLIASMAVRENAVVATFDVGLKKRLKKAGVQIITLKA